MTYVEKMTERIIGRCECWPEGPMEEFINQIIADTKRACKWAIEPKLIYADNVHCKKAIDQAEVKGE